MARVKLSKKKIYTIMNCNISKSVELLLSSLRFWQWKSEMTNIE